VSEPAAPRPPRSLKRSFASLVLVGELLVVGFAALVANNLTDVDGRTLAVVTAAVAVLCLLAAGSLRSRVGYLLGWLVQVLLVLSGFWVTLMFFLGAAFAVLWWLALRTGARADAVTARRRAAERR
jgi:fatty acid desaturase